MSRQIRMKFDFQGLRPDGTPWPPYNGLLVTNDEEADFLVNAEHAEELDAPLRGGFTDLLPLSEDWRDTHPVPTAKDTADDVSYAAPDEDDIDEDGYVKRPWVTARKDKWIAYAISQGADPEVAKSLTREELIAQFGASL